MTTTSRSDPILRSPPEAGHAVRCNCGSSFWDSDGNVYPDDDGNNELWACRCGEHYLDATSYYRHFAICKTLYKTWECFLCGEPAIRSTTKHCPACGKSRAESGDAALEKLRAEPKRPPKRKGNGWIWTGNP